MAQRFLYKKLIGLEFDVYRVSSAVHRFALSSEAKTYIQRRGRTVQEQSAGLYTKDVDRHQNRVDQHLSCRVLQTTRAPCDQAVK